MSRHEQTIEALELVSEQQMHLNQAVKKIRSMQYRTLGRKKVAVSEDQRKQMIHAAVTQCNLKCSVIYNKINQERLKVGLPELQNPYKE